MSQSYYEQVQRKLADNIRLRRRQLGLTQEAAAQTIGMATRHFQKLEAGELNITLHTLSRVAWALGLELGDLFAGTTLKDQDDTDPSNA